MSEDLDIHPANEAERIAAFRNVHDVWSGGLNLDDHLQRRLTSPQHNRADWYVGCLGGRVVASLGCYPLQLRLRGDIVGAIAIGAVHTLAEFRGRGFAPQLMRHVEDAAANRGIAISLLYSDIDPDYYARRGYIECPSLEWDFTPAEIEDGDLRDDSFTLRRDTATSTRRIVKELYDEFHETLPLAVHRDEEYWRYVDRKGRGDDVYLLGDAAREPLGYLRVRLRDGLLKVRDFAMRLPVDEALVTRLSAALQIASDRSATQITGWVPPLPERLAFSRPRPRSGEITMLKPLREGISIDETVREAAAFFHEIDHV